MRTTRTGAPFPVLVVWGLESSAAHDVALRLQAQDRGLLQVYVDPCSSEEGLVEIGIRGGGEAAQQPRSELRNLGHPCVSCALSTVVADILEEAAFQEGHSGAVLVLHPAVEVDVAVGALHRSMGRWGRLASVVTVLSRGWYSQLASAMTLRDAGIDAWDASDRASSTLLAAGIEDADLIVLPGRPPEAPEPAAVLSALAPAARRVWETEQPSASDLLAARREPGRRADVFEADGLRAGHPLPDGPHGLSVGRWRTPRPLHPQRLWEQLDDLAVGLVRSTGRLWFATRPDLVLAWDTAGDALRLGSATRWLLPAPDEEATPCDLLPSAAHRAHAARHVHPYYGDRDNDLAFLGSAEAVRAAQRIFERCVLSDEELAGGPGRWRTLADPFPLWRIPDHVFAAT